MQPAPRVDVLGVHISATNLDRAVQTISTWIEHKTPRYVCVTGVHGVIECQSDPDLREIHNQSGMTTPDGMPLVWAAKAAGAEDCDRVYGPDLVEQLLSHGAELGWKVFLYGGADGVAADLGTVIETRFTGIVCAGSFSPPFRALSEAEELDIAERINESGADIVLVGLSTPKQERWMASFRPKLDVPVLIGVGAVFDFFTGNVRQAPIWIQRAGLEWAFRLLMEPRRLWRRYTSIVPRFIFSILRTRPTLVPSAETD